VVLTQDGEVLVSHDVELDMLTDVADRYPERARGDGRFYALDFTLAEIRSLRSGERLDHATGQPAYPGRFAEPPETQPMMTLNEWVELVGKLNFETNRAVGLCVELKSPVYHERAGGDLVLKTAEILARFGYDDPEARCMLMSFEPLALLRLRQAMAWRGTLLQLIGPPEWGESDFDYARLATPSGLSEIATYAQWIATHVPQVVTIEAGESPRPTGLVATAHAAGLNVGAYTFQHEGLPEGHTMAGLIDFAVGPLRLDAVISDFPAEAIAALERRT
jgi:glycerophosphoryl diester phosphodiesterase